MNILKKIKVFFSLVTIIFSGLLLSCHTSEREISLLSYNFDKIDNRVWIGEDFFAMPLEDWQVKDGRLESVGVQKNARVNLLRPWLINKGELDLSARIGIMDKDAKNGSVGFELGLQDSTDNDIRSLCFYGRGIKVGIDVTGYLFIDDKTIDLPDNFSLHDFNFSIEAAKKTTSFELSIEVQDENNRTAKLTDSIASLNGIINLVTNFSKDIEKNSAASFWFDDIQIKGTMMEQRKENTFGPLLFNMYTLSRNTMKMSVQMPPLGKNDTKEVQFQIRDGESFKTIETATIEDKTNLAVFKMLDWDSTKDHPYRLMYNMRYTDGTSIKHHLNGIINKEPKNKELTVAGLTCQQYQAYPYRPLVETLVEKNPDLLFFSGDQIYEQNGGFPIIRDNEERSILNYLSRWYMYGWAFKDVLKNRPTICITDDHEMYQGNLWGENGKTIKLEDWKKGQDDLGGFVQPLGMIDVVMKTNCSHLPDPFDASPMNNDIPVYYTDLLYGGVSFAIVADRTFKSAPAEVAFWEGRKDHLKFELEDSSILSKPNLELLGKRQLSFLEHWVKDWEGAEMKCLLSQTIFSNSATHHGADRMFLKGDLDSGGWPKIGRDKALKVIRKAAAFHICGDQHLTILEQYGLDVPRDAGWAFCTPSISVGYERRFQPDLETIPFTGRKDSNNKNTGNYTDIFGNYFYVEAVGNPTDDSRDTNRYKVAQKRASGFGLITFDTSKRTITSDAIRFLPDSSGDIIHFEGWPFTVSQLDNFGHDLAYRLPFLEILNSTDVFIEILDSNNQLVMALPMLGNTMQPKLHSRGDYTINFTDRKSKRMKSIILPAMLQSITLDTLKIKI